VVRGALVHGIVVHGCLSMTPLKYEKVKFIVRVPPGSCYAGSVGYRVVAGWCLALTSSPGTGKLLGYPANIFCVAALFEK
jgi:hypothetical protein